MLTLGTMVDRLPTKQCGYSDDTMRSKTNKQPKYYNMSMMQWTVSLNKTHFPQGPTMLLSCNVRQWKLALQWATVVFWETWANTWSTWTMPRSCSSFVWVLILCILYYILYKLSRVDNDPWSCSSFVSLDWDQGFQHHLSKWLRTESVAHYKSPKDWLELIPGWWRWWWTRRLTRGWRMRWMRM